MKQALSWSDKVGNVMKDAYSFRKLESLEGDPV